jgi:mannose-6-phosphate isomerase-like protein (cupin superfamily)
MARIASRQAVDAALCARNDRAMPKQTTVIPPGGGEVIGDSPERRVEILAEHDALHATWARFGPGREGTGLHIHRHHDDVFYVIDGELTIRLGVDDERVVVPAGTFVLVPPLVVHGFLNGSDADVRYLNFHAPGTGFADYMRGLRDGRRVPFDQEPPPDDGVRPPSAATIATGRVESEHIAVTKVRGDPGGQWCYVLDGDLAGSWVAGQPPAGATHLVDVRTPR